MHLPELHFKAWKSTKETIHLYLQIIGKVRMALTPRINHWWHVTLHVTETGLSTGSIPAENVSFRVNFDCLNHLVLVKCSNGLAISIPLFDGLTVAAFYEQFMSALQTISVQFEIDARPYDNPSTIPFPKDDTHSSYDAKAVEKWWRVLVFVDRAFKLHAGKFDGKQSPVQFFWHSFDIALTRFSGKVAQLEGGRVSDREAYSHEVISIGFWPGDENTPFPAFYSYTYPSPEDLEKEDIEPSDAAWHDVNGSPMAILPYDSIRDAEDPQATVLAFAESTYHAGAVIANWPVDSFKIRPLE